MYLDIQRSEWTAGLVEGAEIEGEYGEREYDPSDQRSNKSILVGARARDWAQVALVTHKPLKPTQSHEH